MFMSCWIKGCPDKKVSCPPYFYSESGNFKVDFQRQSLNWLALSNKMMKILGFRLPFMLLQEKISLRFMNDAQHPGHHDVHETLAWLIYRLRKRQIKTRQRAIPRFKKNKQSFL